MERSAPTPRDNLPESLCGVPDPAVVEFGLGHPWLTLTEVNRLVRQQGIAPTLARAWVIDELVHAIPLSPEREQELSRSWLEERAGVNSGEALEAWLTRQRLQPADVSILATQAERLHRFQRHRWGDELEVHFLRRKPDLDQVVYSLLRVGDQGLAEELHQRLQEQEASFEELAASYAEGQERHTQGRIGPLPINHAHPEIAGRLRVGVPGKLWPPFAVAQFWVLLRLEERLPARLNEQTSLRMMGELFETWLQQRVDMVLAGEPLPPLPPLPAASEDIPPS